MQTPTLTPLAGIGMLIPVANSNPWQCMQGPDLAFNAGRFAQLLHYLRPREPLLFHNLGGKWNIIYSG